jgi:hypothetical protein
MFRVCVVCAFFCVCVQVEAFRRVDHPSKESYRTLPTVLDVVTEVKQKVSWRRPRPELGCRAKGKKLWHRSSVLHLSSSIRCTARKFGYIKDV